MENFVVIVKGILDDDTLRRINEILDSLGAILMNTRQDDVCIKYFYTIRPKYLDHTKKILEDQVREKNVIFEIN